MSPKEDNLLMIQDANAFVKKDYEPAVFHGQSFYRHARAVLDEPDVRSFDEDEEQFPTLPMLLDTKIQPRSESPTRL